MKLRPVTLFENKINALVFLLIVTALVYAKTLTYGFTPLDEKWLILDRADYLKLWGNLPKSFTDTLYDMYYRPLLAVSIFIDFRIGGIHPFVYHLTNLLWHLASVFCLFKLLVLYNVPNKTATALTLVFAVHPGLVHAVAWVPGRNDIMLCVFTLASLIYLKKYLVTEKTSYLALHLFLFICALFTKENAFLLPLLFSYVVYREIRGKKILLAILLWILSASLWLTLRNTIVSVSTTSSSLPLSNKLVNFGSGLTVYLGKIFLPFHQSVHPTVESITLLFGALSFILVIFLFFRPGIQNKKNGLSGLP